MKGEVFLQSGAEFGIMPEGKDFIERKAEGFMKAAEKTMDMITGLCKNRGFIFPGSEIYGGLANT